jgi:hypothetical protein
MSHRRINTRLVLIFALVQGMWMGAQLHTLSAAHARPVSAVAGCGCAKTSSKTQIVSQSSCEVCATGALMQDAPASVTVLAAPTIVLPHAIPSIIEVCPTPALPLHPGRGPPSAA